MQFNVLNAVTGSLSFSLICLFIALYSIYVPFVAKNIHFTAFVLFFTHFAANALVCVCLQFSICLLHLTLNGVEIVFNVERG